MMMGHSTQRRRRTAGTDAGAGAVLADRLLQAAAALISQHGSQVFSLREVARRAGVSEAAPYWHFPSKEALLAAVAEQGFVGLAAAMGEAQAHVKGRRRQLKQLGIAYVRFALAHPSHLRIMFGPEIRDKTAHPRLHAAAERAFGLLVAAVTEAQRTGDVRRGNPRDLAVAAWALVHGLAALLVDGQLRDRVRSAREAERLAARVTKLLQTGLSPQPS
jgi:AcrR family transcriptional regulator